ncbi:MAG: hypothetical protein K2X90_03370 [Candidatus Babeliaceae bacterium]|nr:hypothetical protein [Candidatus Babeliaceae bacterium]
MKKIVISLFFLTSTAIIKADVLAAALNSESTPFLSPEGGQPVTTRFTGRDPDNPDPARSTYNFAMDYGAAATTNPSSWNSMRRLWGTSNG